MHLQKASLIPPPSLAALLQEIGEGENGFGGTSFGRGQSTLPEFLRDCIDGENVANIAAWMVPQTIFWMIDDQGEAIGMVRVRHFLNDRLLQGGGHIGYYVRRQDRGKGYATAALRMALDHLRTLGVTRALLTVQPSNEPSIHVVLANGGQFENQSRSPDAGEILNRYWIELQPSM